MAKVRFVARQVPTGIPGSLMLEIVDGEEAVAIFLRQLHQKQKAEGGRALEENRNPREYLITTELQVHYQQRTLKQNNLQWELCKRLGAADHVDPQTVHDAMKHIVYPAEEHYGAFIPKDGSELSTVEFAAAIEWLMAECLDRPDPVDIHDIWILFTEWRYQQPYDPLENSYSSLADYKGKHPCCEVCGRFLLQRNNEGEYVHVGHLCHIVSKGAGGPDEPWNVLVMCSDHHVSGEIAQHQRGWEATLTIAPWLRPKYDRAHALAAKAGREQDDFQDDIPWEDGGGDSPQPSHQAPVDEPAPQEAPREHPAETLMRVFQGELISGEIPRPGPEKPPEVAKQLMLDRLSNLTKVAEEKQEKYYGKHSKPSEVPADTKKAQYKDDEEEE